MQTKMQYAALVACALLIIPASALADNSSTQNQSSIQESYTNAILARVTCQASLDTGVISATISDIPNINQTAITSDSNKISTDSQSLVTDSNNKDKSQFQTDMKSFRTDSKNATKDLRLAVNNAKPTSDERTKLKSDFASLQDTYRSCMFSAGQQSANLKIHAWGTGIQKMENRSSILASKGVDITQLNQIISQAQTNLGNLAAAVSSATNSTQLKDALHGYCQYNGCKNGINFHFAAKSVLAAQQAKLDKIKSNPNSGQYGNQINQAQTNLTNAKNTLDAVGTSQYQGTQKNDVWNPLHDVYSIIKQLWSELHDKSKTTASSSSTSSNLASTLNT
jgi:hypothetical protein